MPSYFTVVQYVPDPVVDERINIGVIVFGEGQVTSRFVENWNHVRSFGSESINYLRKFANEVDRMDENSIRKCAETWSHSIQLTKPAGSLLSPPRLLVDMSSRYLREWAFPTKTYRGRLQAIGMARTTIRKAAEGLMGREAKRLIKNDLLVHGPEGEHPFDVGAENGRPYFAARALSFEGGREDAMIRHVESTAFALEDVRKLEQDLPLAIFVLPPKKTSQIFDQAIGLFEKHATIVKEDELENWATSMAQLVDQSWYGGHNRRSPGN
jgi:hypothetical protein